MSNNLCESLEEANYSLLQVLDEQDSSNWMSGASVLLLDNDTQKPEVWYLHEDAPSCYTIHLDIDGVTYYAEFGYTPSVV